ncbi:Cathepsin_B [Hexamita inflata]|uniref:Cathepsin_B n=1 Tax=Hexamita inflata TaxID=28002 RepID=A0ABP1H6C1_9EUKA
MLNRWKIAFRLSCSPPQTCSATLGASRTLINREFSIHISTNSVVTMTATGVINNQTMTLISLVLEEPFGAVPESCVSYTSGKTGKVPKCPTKCDDGSNLPSRVTMDDAPSITWAQRADWDTIEEMVQSMVREGPVQMGFNAYSDLMFYSGGVYSHSFGESLGEFRGEVVGWGTANGVKFWKMKMSYGQEWGERGFLRIAQAELITRLWYFTM